jgi:hypothetical protein
MHGSRRQLLGQAGLAAFLLGLSRRPAHAALVRPFLREEGALPPIGRSRPLHLLPDAPEVIPIAGFPFAPHWFGDPWSFGAIPFHSSETQFPGGTPPVPDEEVDLAVVGGGLSGLALAYLLREHHPVVFELHDRFGGVSQGESWRGVPYSQGGAYFIAPDEGSQLEQLYFELGLDRVRRVSEGDDPVELQGAILHDFWAGAAVAPEERIAFERYARLVQHHTLSYPEIPLPEGKDNGWILELDQRTLRDDVAARIGVPIPRLLEAGVEGYCYSSFDASWREISAAAGWNFLAAEEFGRWVCPGGNAWVADELWRRLVRSLGNAGHIDRLRPATRVVQVDVDAAGRALITYRKPQGSYHTLRARRAALCCSKHVCKYLIRDLAQHDPARLGAMQHVTTHPYLVANVLLDAPVALDFYDLFLLEDGHFPFTGQQLEDGHRPIDVVAGHYAFGPGAPRSVLTLYWPRPTGEAMFDLLAPGAYQAHAEHLAPHLVRLLATLGLERSQVRAVRLTRWGHAMPIPYPRFLTDGVPQLLRRPYRGSVFFVNQDNWALPAFETCLLEALAIAPRIAAAL